MLRIMRLALLFMSAQIAIGQLTGVWEQRSPYPLPATEVSGAPSMDSCMSYVV